MVIGWAGMNRWLAKEAEYREKWKIRLLSAWHGRAAGLRVRGRSVAGKVDETALDVGVDAFEVNLLALDCRGHCGFTKSCAVNTSYAADGPRLVFAAWS